MAGILRVRHSASHSINIQQETLGAVSFQTVLVNIRGDMGFWDRLYLRRGLYKLKKQGVTEVAAPEAPYINAILMRYHMQRVTHWKLLGAMAPQIMDFVLQQDPAGAVLLYAQTVDEEVSAAAHYAAENYRTIMLEGMGIAGEYLRRELMDTYGTAALLGAIPTGAPKTVALLFARPASDFHRILPGVVEVALCKDAVQYADFDAIRLLNPPFSPLEDSDPEGILRILSDAEPALAKTLCIEALYRGQRG